MPGSGETLDGGGKLEIDGVVSCMVGVIDAEGHERVHLVGWSLGAVVAAAVAAEVPSRVRTLTLANGWATTDARMRFTFDLWKRLLASDPELFARYVLADGLGRESFEMFGPGIEDLIPATAAGFAPGSDRQLDLDIDVDISARLSRITAPTLVIGGTVDRWVDVVHSRELATAISGARLVELPCGHLVPTEQAEALNALLLDHFAAG
jgi:pimeloyl-ACP methyl ester carboxylesterase